MNEQDAVQATLKVLKPFVRNEEKFKTAGADTRIWEDLNVNSARFIDILLAFEAEFNLEIDDTVAENVSTVGDVAKILLEYGKAHPEVAKAALEKFHGAHP